MTISQRVVLKFPRDLVDKPTISLLVKKYDLEFNILQAHILPQKEGLMVIVFTGEEKVVRDALKELKSQNVGLQLLKQDIIKNETLCTHCGACVGLCPSNALYLDPHTRKVLFDPEKCIACLICIKGCIMKAMEVKF